MSKFKIGEKYILKRDIALTLKENDLVEVYLVDDGLPRVKVLRGGQVGYKSMNISDSRSYLKPYNQKMELNYPIY